MAFNSTFPTTILYTWETKNPLEDIISMTNGLSMASSYSTNWEIEVLLKFAKQNKQNTSQQNSRGKNDSSSASYFVRQPDIGVCCCVSKENTDYDDVFVGTDADILNKFQNFTQRSLWKASGQRFYIGTCLISVGTIEHAGSALKPCIEISHCPTDEEKNTNSIVIKVENSDNIDDDKNSLRTKEELYIIAYQLHNVVMDLLAAHTAVQTLPIPITLPIPVQTKVQPGSTKDQAEQPDSPLIISISSRAMHWITLVT
mmetsp:Transcript_5579/g.5735  ORF Transcript_5579/g.5735 Transcript_5579/m.5735 type:complete len:257 (-) Transcript_5579:294-1064(-)